MESQQGATRKNKKKEMQTVVKVFYGEIMVGEVATNRSISVDEALKLIGFDEQAFIAEHGFDDIDYNEFTLDYDSSVKVERIEFMENFPNQDEAYAILTDGQRFAFAWGSKYPYEEEVPTQDIKDGESGIEWHDSEDAARTAMNQAMKAWEVQG